MVTGDNVHTAQSIARECGILTEDGVSLEGPIFRTMSEEQLLPILPTLQVRLHQLVYGLHRGALLVPFKSFAHLLMQLPSSPVQVLARSSPTDKFTLVTLLKKSGEVVAVTGDGDFFDYAHMDPYGNRDCNDEAFIPQANASNELQAQMMPLL